MDGHASFGLALALFGIPFAAFSHWILSNVPLTALGLACIILGATIMCTPSSPVPKQATRMMVEGSCVNIEALLEEFNATEKALYLPPREGRVYALVPLKSNPRLLDADEARRAPIRVITRAGDGLGLLIFPPGSELVRLSGITADSSLEDALSQVLVDLVEAVESVRAVREGDTIIVDLVGPRLRTDFQRFRRVFGSLEASIAGCVLASCLEAQILFEEERMDGRKARAVFRVIS